MSLVRPKALREREVVAAHGKRVLFRDYEFPDNTIESFLVWGATPPPVIGMPVTKDGSVVLIKHFRYGVGKFVLEFPGGCPEPHQTREEALRAEIDQETGYSCGEILKLTSLIPFEPAACTTQFVPFLVTGCEYVHPCRPDATEILEVVEIPQDSFFENIARLSLDAKTLAIALLASPHLGYSFARK